MNEERIVIGKDRFITVPESLKRLAVQYDHNIETLTFECPRYWDEHDLSTMNIYINYHREDGIFGRTPCTTKSVDSDNPSIMLFTWTVPRHATEVDGRLAILVCIKSSDESGVLTRDWNSEVCTDFYISEGFEVANENTDSYKDSLEAWYQSVINASVVDISQTTTSTENLGVNVITATFGDGSKKTFEIRNGGVTPNAQVGYSYSMTIKASDWVYMGDAVNRYSVTKTVPNLTSNCVIFPSTSETALWIDNDLDVTANNDAVTVSVATVPDHTVIVGLTIVNTVSGGNL